MTEDEIVDQLAEPDDEPTEGIDVGPDESPAGAASLNGGES